MLTGEQSAFPHPAYVVGLAKEWLFEQPFDTRPVDLAQEGSWPQPVAELQAIDALEYIASIISTPDDASLAVA